VREDSYDIRNDFEDMNEQRHTGRLGALAVQFVRTLRQLQTSAERDKLNAAFAYFLRETSGLNAANVRNDDAHVDDPRSNDTRKRVIHKTLVVGYDSIDSQLYAAYVDRWDDAIARARSFYRGPAICYNEKTGRSSIENMPAEEPLEFPRSVTAVDDLVWEFA
jgi:hypothetical protein